jgi:uncharacterized membrane protein
MAFVFVLLITLILLFGGGYYGYQARAYDLRQFIGGLFAVVAVLLVFFLLANKD